MPHRYIYNRLRQAWLKTAGFMSHKVLHLDDTPHRIALGVAIGFFIAWTPLLGGHMVLALILCTVLRANKVAGVTFVWVCNPVTMWPIYYSSYRLGCALLPGMSCGKHAWHQITRRLMDETVPIWTRISELGHLSWNVIVPLVTGSTLDGIIVGVLAYWVTYRAVAGHRRRAAMHRAEAAMAGHGTESKG